MKHIGIFIILVATVGTHISAESLIPSTIRFDTDSSQIEQYTITQPLKNWSFEAEIQPWVLRDKNHCTIQFSGESGKAIQVMISPRGGGVLLKPAGGLEKADAVSIRRNPTMNLSEGEYTYKLPFRIRIIGDESTVQVYLGFHGLPADFIHAEMKGELPPVKNVSISCSEGKIDFANISFKQRSGKLPDLDERKPVGDAMPTWNEFVGTHYIPRDGINLYRGLFYDPVIYRVVEKPGDRAETDFRPWVAYVSPDEIPLGCVKRTGPFSGKPIWIHQERINSILKYGKQNNIWMIHGRDVQKRTEYYAPAEVEIRKDELYWSVRLFYEDRAYQDVPILFQLGNEVNAFHVPAKNHPHLVDRYVEYNFAPAAEAIRRVGKDVYGDPDKIRFILGSVTSAWPLGHGWLTKMANHRIQGDFAPSLRGTKVSDLTEHVAVHYLMKGPFWSHALEAVYGRLVETGKFQGLWSTEEMGGNADLDRGPFVVAQSVRYMDWWSRHDWSPKRGGLIFWGDTRSKSDYTTALDIESMFGAFLGARPLSNLTDQVSIEGTADVEGYVFKGTSAEETHLLITVTSKDYWFFPNNNSTGSAIVEKISIPLDSNIIGKAMRQAWYRVVDNKIEPLSVKLRTDETGHGLVMSDKVSLDKTQQEVLIGFLTDSRETMPEVFDYRFPKKERPKYLDEQVIYSFHMGNDLTVDMLSDLSWKMLSDAGSLNRQKVQSERVNADSGMLGDHHGLSLDRRNGQRIEYCLEIDSARSATAKATLRLGIAGDPVELWWDNELLASEVSVTNPEVLISESKVHLFDTGLHKIEFRNSTRESSSVDFLIIKWKGSDK